MNAKRQLAHRLILAAVLILPACSASAGGVTTASSGNVAAATATATLPAIAATSQLPAGTWEVTAFEITASGATAAIVVSPTITGLLGGTMTLTFSAPAGVLAGATPLIAHFNPPLDGIPGQAIVLSMPTLGSGNTNATVVLHGFSK
ncbi:MAG: hypothetical protein C5B60_10315 [Chloroflexi bacterium]|nr:MAG: hypothetical protein C5B60_10315 [Chloroflexota bacterium]